jgi:DNA-binding protein HU-beta
MTTKAEIVEDIASQFDISKKMSGEILNAFLDGVTKSLKKGEGISFIGFGAFSVKKRAARKGKNPATGEVIKIAAKKVPHFKAGAKLKEAVGGKKKK